MTHRVAPQVGQGNPVNRRNKHPGQGNPRLSQVKQLAANPDETVRKRNSKSVSFGASGRKVIPILRLSACVPMCGNNDRDHGNVCSE